MLWKNQVQMEQSVVGRWGLGGGAAGAIRSLVNVRDLQLKVTSLA